MDIHAGLEPAAIIPLAQAFEERITVPAATPAQLADVRTLHLLALLHEGKLDQARFLWRSIDDAAKAPAVAPALSAAWSVCRSAIEDKIPEAVATLAGAAFAGTQQPLAARVADAIRRRKLSHLQKVYSRISVSAVSAALGLTVAEAVGFATSQGFTLDSTSPVLLPSTTGAGADVGASTSSVDHHTSLAALSSYVSRLEANKAAAAFVASAAAAEAKAKSS